MPRAAAASDSDSERATKSNRKSVSATKAFRTKKPEEDVEVNEGSEGEEEGEEEEYEIEKILDAKLGTFDGGRMGYLVKWKGYSEENNSWVDEKDAENAQVLIDDYWRNHKQKKFARKSAGTASKASTAKPRKSSTLREESSEVEDTRPKKRGRPSKAKPVEKEEDQDEDVEKQVPKRARKSTGNKSAKAASPMDLDEDEDVPVFRDMKTWKNSATWEHIVDSIDTVERDAEGQLLVYFTLKNNQGRARESSTLCKEKMPRKLLDFYERNLRWRTSDEME